MKIYKTGQSILKGFSLIELMIVIAIIGVLASVAIPSYNKYIQKSKRNNAMAMLLKAQSTFEGQYTTNSPPSFPTGSTTPTAASIMSAFNNSDYTFTAVSTATSYTLTATAQGSQANDTDSGVSCTPLSIDNTNTRSPSNCWH